MAPIDLGDYDSFRLSAEAPSVFLYYPHKLSFFTFIVGVRTETINKYITVHCADKSLLRILREIWTSRKQSAWSMAVPGLLYGLLQNAFFYPAFPSAAHGKCEWSMGYSFSMRRRPPSIFKYVCLNNWDCGLCSCAEIGSFAEFFADFLWRLLSLKNCSWRSHVWYGASFFFPLREPYGPVMNEDDLPSICGHCP